MKIDARAVAVLAVLGVLGLTWLSRRRKMRSFETPGGGRIKNLAEPPESDLVTVPGVGGKPIRLHHAAWEAWQALRAAAIADGIDPRRLGIHSGYRAKAHQAKLYADALRKYGSEKEARKWVAKPGGSAHQTGRAVDTDLDGGSISSARVAEMRRSPAWLWLSKNAARFGYFPYEKEPWHWVFNP